MRTVAHISAQRPMKDSVNWAAIPVGTPLVAGYVPPSHFAWPPQAWARFAGSIEIRITPSASVTGKGIQVLDVEPGDASAGQVPGWVAAQRACGQEPTPYCSMAAWPSVIRAINAARLAHPPYWVAGYPGGGAVLPSIVVDGHTYTATAHQYADPNSSGGDYDLSVVASYWPGVDQGAQDVNLSDNITVPSGPNAGKVLADVNDTLYFIDVYAGQAATVVQDPNVGNAALAAQLKTVSAKLDALSGQVTKEETDLLAAIKANAAVVDPSALAAALEAAGFPQALVAALLAVLNKAAA